MRVILTLSGLTSPEGRQKVAEIGTAPFRVGRSPEADWTLEDPTNQISRVHFELRAEAGGLVVTDVSSRGTALDQPGARLQSGQPAPLGERSRLIVPGGEVEVAIDRTARPAAPPPPAAAPPPFGGAAAPRGAAERPPDTAEIEDVFGIRARATQTTPTPFSPSPPPPQPRRPAAPFLPSLSGGARPPGRPTLGTPAATGTPAAPGPTRSAPSFDDLLRGGGAPAAPSDLPQPAASPAPPPFLAASPTPPAPPAAAPADPAPATPRPAAPGTGAAAKDGVAGALFEAMGIDTARMTAEEQAALAAEVGRTCRALAQGMRRLLDGRRAVKRELGIAGTEIAVGANPLKVLPDPQAAAEALVRPPLPGFLSGEAAVEDAVASMLHHQMALVGGIRSAMRIALATFDPAEIEQRLAARGLSQVVPALRRAELWERFCETYAQFAEQADDDIRKVIGSELEKLYSRD